RGPVYQFYVPKMSIMPKFNYARYNGTNRPIVPIKLKNSGQEIGYHVLVDSGADICLFHAEIGEAIGIDITKGEKREVFGVGGKASIYYLHKVTLEVGGWEYKVEAGFLPTVGTRIVPYGIVGQIGFFEFFKVIFDQQAGEIELKKK
ncbi:MAG: aspartyl protease family protein, partial [Patescibacteria group bacterium]